MKKLLVKSELAREAKEPIVEKMRRILESHVDEAKTEDDRKRALRALRRFTRADRGAR
jgi:CRISPR/Cas system CSM-associated protein Csm2 small subunit